MTELGRWQRDQIYLYRHPVDMRKGVDSLAVLVVEQLELDPTDSALYAFISKSGDKIKIICYDRNGFWMLYKKLIKQRFKWPKWFNDDRMCLSVDHFCQLLSGIDLNGLKPHEKIVFQHFA